MKSCRESIYHSTWHVVNVNYIHLTAKEKNRKSLRYSDDICVCVIFKKLYMFYIYV